MRPELLSPISLDEAARYVVNDRFWLQQKWDAERLLVHKCGGQIEVWNKLGRPTAISPALISVLRRISVSEFILDGEIQSSGYYCWDLLRANDADLTSYPYKERFQILQAFSPCPFVRILPAWKSTDEKEKMIFDLYSQGAEGVVFKDSLAPYKPGRAGQHSKLKFVKTATVRVRSVDPLRDSIRIEMLGPAGWQDVSGLKMRRGLVQVGDFVEVRYSTASASRRLVQPVFIRIRRDVTSADCKVEQLEFSGRWAKIGARP